MSLLTVFSLSPLLPLLALLPALASLAPLALPWLPSLASRSPQALVPLLSLILQFLHLYSDQKKQVENRLTLTNDEYFANDMINYMLLGEGSEAMFGGRDLWTILVKAVTRVLPLALAPLRIAQSFEGQAKRIKTLCAGLEVCTQWGVLRLHLCWQTFHCCDYILAPFHLT